MTDRRDTGFRDSGQRIANATLQSSSLQPSSLSFLVKPTPIAAAVAELDARSPIRSTLRTAEWADVPLALRRRAFFSAGVDWAQFLDASKDKLAVALALRKEQTARGTAHVDRSSFIGDLRKQVLAAGQGKGTDPRDLTDLASRARLGLIYDMQTQSATGFARFKFEQGPAVLNAFPAQELLPSTARNPRDDWEPRWIRAGGALVDGRLVALKTDPIWSAISRFGTPWTPFDFGSTRQLRDLDRAEAQALGLIRPDQELEPIDAAFDQDMQASVTDLAPDTLSALQAAFGDQIQIRDGKAQWRAAA